MKNSLINSIRNQYELIFKICLLLFVITLIVFLLPKEGKFKYDFQKNKPWVHEDLLAPFDFAINKTKEELAAEKTEIEKNHSFYFNNNNITVKNKVLKSFNSWIDSNWKDSLKLGATEKYKALGIKYFNEIYSVGVIELIDAFDEKEANLSVMIMEGDNLVEEVELQELYTIKSAYDYVVKDIDSHLEIKPKFFLSAIENTIEQSIKYDKTLTKKDLENELNNISIVKGGVYEKEKIISRGEIVSDEKFSILQSLKEDYEAKLGTSHQSIWLVLGQIIIVSLLVFSIFIFLKNANDKVFNSNMDIGFISIIVVGFVAITVLVLKFEKMSVYMIPFTIIPLLIRTFFGNRLALFVYLIAIFLISFMVPNSFEFVIIETIAGIVILFTVLTVNKRAEVFYTSLVTFLIFSITYFGISLMQESSIENIAWNNFGWFGIAAGFSLLTYPLIYLFEKVFGYISDVTLLELSDTNNKLLRELNFKAPGTFQHSLQVSNLAEEAIREIGGNPLLVRTGALYHDIGKMLAPAYFIENQTSINPHDELAYEESADIIINHVIKGIELAKEHKLPEQIIDFIRTHHGTTKAQYFLRMYKNENPEEVVDDTLFQYPGPIPYSKETAVLMMADSVEAASRSLKTYDADTITKLVEGVISSQVTENQFVNTNITFNDVTTIKKMFIKKLMNIYHVRIEYPK
jgi:putative nucleotidyltransferase with HDIG domain